ncbi:MAG: PQQ-like beta-propeller repeat protein [Chloroflexi bacterium]|nr:PQQ-like beta-propeller repeat protein [Chloroflexota bacterium]
MKHLKMIFLVLLGAILLSACATGATSTSWPGLSADSTNAYLADGNNVYAVRLSDGVKVWQYPDKAGTPKFFAAPVLTPDGQLLIASAGTDRAFLSLDPATGKEKWAAPYTGAQNIWIASPLVVGDMIYAANNDGTLYVLKLATGEFQWSLPISGSLWGAPVSNGKLVFVTSLDHFLYAIDPQSRKVAWKADLGGSIPGSPAVSADGSTLYIGGFTKKVTAINAADGAIRWTAETKDWVWDAPALDGDTVYAADISGYIYSLGAANGKNAWPELQPDGPITASPLVLSDGTVVFVTESGLAYAFDRASGKAWGVGTNIGGKIYTTPVISGELILVAPLGADSLLVALNKGGNVAWKFTGK